MPGNLVVLTGVHKIIGMMLAMDTQTFGDVLYYPSISDDLKSLGAQGHWETCPFFDHLLMHQEIDRDSMILPLLKDTQSVAFIEQWHIGNIAWAKTRSPEVGREYEGRFRDLLRRFEGIDIKIWYISTDLEKMMPVSRELYQAYLRELSTMIKHFNFHPENLDGDAPPHSVEERIKYLLTKKRL